MRRAQRLVVRRSVLLNWVTVMKIKKQYVVNKQNKPIGVILDLATFEKLEELVEDHFLGEILQDAAKEEPISLEEAKHRYARMKKPRVRKYR